MIIIKCHQNVVKWYILDYCYLCLRDYIIEFSLAENNICIVDVNIKLGCIVRKSKRK